MTQEKPSAERDSPVTVTGWPSFSENQDPRMAVTCAAGICALSVMSGRSADPVPVIRAVVNVLDVAHAAAAVRRPEPTGVLKATDPLARRDMGRPAGSHRVADVKGLVLLQV